MPVRLTFLGSGDAFGSGGRLQACLHLDGGPESLLLDCGATAVIALKRAGIEPASVGYVALSHLHGDHFAGVPWLILDGQFAKRTNDLVIAGPEGTRDRVRRTFEALYPGAADAERDFDTHFLELTEQTPCHLGPASITPFQVQHGGGAVPYSLRVDYAGKVIAYSGDTEWTDALLEVADGADLFVCECNFFDRQAPGHLDYRTLESKRSQLTCKRMVITHMSAEMLERSRELGVDAADDGAAIVL